MGQNLHPLGSQGGIYIRCLYRGAFAPLITVATSLAMVDHITLVYSDKLYYKLCLYDKEGAPNT